METLPKKVAVTGASGLIGTALTTALREQGVEVIRLVRRRPQADDEAWCDPAVLIDALAFSGVDAVVNLAGAPIGTRWSDAYRRKLRDSRVQGTSALIAALHNLERPIRVVSASAIGFYGDQDEKALTEDSPAGTGFLADLCSQWEQAACPPAESALSVAYARTSIVLSAAGGALGGSLGLAHWGLWGPLGSGKQWWPWISLQDEVRALIFLLSRPDITGPVNLCAPIPIRQSAFAASLGRSLRRPALLPTPAPLLQLALGGFAEELLSSRRLHPQVLEAAGFTWEESNLDQCLDRIVASKYPVKF